jgi:excisionase family DNA binding protein
MSELFLTQEETARTLRLSLRTIDTLIVRGDLSVRRVGRRVLVPTEEVRRFAGDTGPGLSSSIQSVPALA